MCVSNAVAEWTGLYTEHLNKYSVVVLGKGHGANVLPAASYPRTRIDLWIYCGVTMALLDEARVNTLTRHQVGK